MTSYWKMLVVGLVIYSIYITHMLLGLLDDTFGIAWDSSFHESKSIGDTVWGAQALASIHTGEALLGLVAFAAVVVGLFSRSQGTPPKTPPV
jgi:hypothetical protein